MLIVVMGIIIIEKYFAVGGRAECVTIGGSDVRRSEAVVRKGWV